MTSDERTEHFNRLGSILRRLMELDPDPITKMVVHPDALDHLRQIAVKPKAPSELIGLRNGRVALTGIPVFSSEHLDRDTVLGRHRSGRWVAMEFDLIGELEEAEA